MPKMNQYMVFGKWDLSKVESEIKMKFREKK
jgi:hypothetical protein